MYNGHAMLVVLNLLIRHLSGRAFLRWSQKRKRPVGAKNSIVS